ncbi:Glutaminyl-peptide cyclotransferase [Ceratocystis fimbriata CBS 114723]|uniref:Peptide hydrolase n=1 Tax=Ceratocystis fimbriata CBS 114723 TaxID=1035309 RepID=A0A2C5WEF3_9PEZI|nr:Glutaminyl-peptide cyclotransferase [Ceratocystis fimbriata CBS 114723]
MTAANAFKELSDDVLHLLPEVGDDFAIDNHRGLLAPLLITRVPGTPGQIAAQRHFIDFFSQSLPKWDIGIHNITSKTPATGDDEIPFVNLFFTRDPPWASSSDVGRLTLVAHYDSKYTPKGFIGATDSAAPCAMLMHVARSIDQALTDKWDAMEASGEAGMDEERGVQILLLDGEEAWVEWTNEDSLYGSRALAEDWESEVYPAMSTFRNRLSSIDLFLLLDLLGSPNPKVPSYFLTTHWAYRNMAMLEKRLRNLGKLESTVTAPFLPEIDKATEDFKFPSGISDDHLPFMHRGVPILHIIPSDFPNVWHKIEDDGEHLDIAVCHDWAKIVTAFAIEWMELEDYIISARKGESGSSPNVRRDEGSQEGGGDVHGQYASARSEL